MTSKAAPADFCPTPLSAVRRVWRLSEVVWSVQPEGRSENLAQEYTFMYGRSCSRRDWGDLCQLAFSCKLLCRILLRFGGFSEARGQLLRSRRIRGEIRYVDSFYTSLVASDSVFRSRPNSARTASQIVPRSILADAVESWCGPFVRACVWFCESPLKLGSCTQGKGALLEKEKLRGCFSIFL